MANRSSALIYSATHCPWHVARCVAAALPFRQSLQSKTLWRFLFAEIPARYYDAPPPDGTVGYTLWGLGDSRLNFRVSVSLLDSIVIRDE